MFSLERLYKKINQGNHKVAKKKKNKPKEKQTHPLSFLTLETEKLGKIKKKGKSSEIKGQKSNQNDEILKKKAAAPKCKEKLGISWRFFNKVVTEEAPKTKATDIHLGSGTEIINKIGKCTNEAYTLDQPLDDKKHRHVRKRKRKAGNDMQVNPSNSVVRSENRNKAQNIKPQTKSSAAVSKLESTESEQRQITPKQRSQQLGNKRQKTKMSKNVEARGTRPDESTSDKKSEIHSHPDDYLSFEVAEFYKSISEDMSDEAGESKYTPPTEQPTLPPSHQGNGDVQTISSSSLSEEVQPTQTDWQPSSLSLHQDGHLSNKIDAQTPCTSGSPVQDVQQTEFMSDDCDQHEENTYETDSHDYYTVDTKPCLASRLVGDGSLLVALFPDAKIFINGNYYLKLIFGSVSVLGYKFKEKEEHPVFSPTSHSALSINVLDGIPIKSYEKEKLEESNIPFDWTQEFHIAEDQLIAIVKLSRYESNMTRMLSEMNMVCKHTFRSFDIDIWNEAVGIHLIDETDGRKRNLMCESEEWSPYLRKLEGEISKRNIRIVLCGGKSSGKSTILKFLINSLLNNPNVPEVACLDLDPGQPEFTVPTCLSLTLVSAPLLGPAFSHREKKYFTFQKRILYGEVGATPLLREYMEVASALLAEYRNLKSHVPLIVNTMGFTAHVGFDLMVDVLRIVEPTHVLTINSQYQGCNYPCRLHPGFIASVNRGIVTSPGRRFDYDYTEISSVSKLGTKTPKSLRHINLTGYLSGLWSEGVSEIVGESCNPAVKLDWATVAIYVQGLVVPERHLLQAINASLVALCRIDPDCLEEVGTNLPYRIQNERQWFRLNMVIGFGVVRGIDPVTREVHILTPLTQEQVYEEGVNVIALTKEQLPTPLRNKFALAEAPYRQFRGVKQPSRRL